jgi:hypothetical protein
MLNRSANCANLRERALIYSRYSRILDRRSNTCRSEELYDTIRTIRPDAETYYNRPYTRQQIDDWVAYGSPNEVITKIGQYVEAGAREITPQPTAWNQRAQLERLVTDVITVAVAIWWPASRATRRCWAMEQRSRSRR